MIQAIGLTSRPRRHQLRPAVDDLTFEARPGRVTVLLGPEGSGRTTTLRLMLQLTAGRGTALFRGRPLHRIPHPAREVGVLLGEMTGHPGRTVRGHLRMLAAAAGVPADRADDVLDVVGLSGLADQRTGALSRGMDRRMGIACALIGDPHTLILDEPAEGLSPREAIWLYSLMRGYAREGGTLLVTSGRAEETARIADRVVSISSGRLVADQEAADFARTRLRPRVAVHTPYAERLVAVLTHEGRAAGRDRAFGPLKAVRESGTRVSVYGSDCAEVGELAYRHGILVHRLSDERGDAGDIHTPGPLARADGRRTEHTSAGPADVPETAELDPAELTAEQVLLECEEIEALDELAPEPELAPKPEPLAPSDSGPAERQADPVLVTTSAHAPGDDEPHAAPETAERPEPPEPQEPQESAPPESPTSPEATTKSRTPDTAGTPETTGTSQPPGTVIAHDPEAPTVPLTGPLADTPVADTSGAHTRLTHTPLGTAPKSPPLPGTPDPPRPAAPPRAAPAELPPPLHSVPRPGPAAPLRYELHRLTGLRSTWTVLVLATATAFVLALVMAGTGAGLPPGSSDTPARTVRILMGWPYGGLLPLPPAAFAAGLLGALAFGEEFRHPALAPAGSAVPRRASLLAAKLAVSGTLAVLLCTAVALLNAAAVALFFGPEALALPAALPFAGDAFAQESSGGSAASADGPWRLHIVTAVVFAVGSAWTGVLAAGVFRSGIAGTAAVLAIPLLVTPVVRTALNGAGATDAAPGATVTGLPERLESALLMPWPPGTARWLAALLELASQPLGCALVLALAALFTGYFTVASGRRAA